MGIVGGPDRILHARQQPALALRQFGSEELDSAKLVRAREFVERRKEFSEIHGRNVTGASEHCQSSSAGQQPLDVAHDFRDALLFLQDGVDYLKMNSVRTKPSPTGYSRCPLQSLACVVEHQVKDAIALFCENNTVVAFGKMCVQHGLYCRPHAPFALCILEPILN